MRLVRPDLRPKDFLTELLTGSGRSLALSHPECSCDITRTIAILLSQDEVQRELICEDLVRPFLEVPNWENANTEDDDAVGSDVPGQMAMVQQSLFRSIYDVTALPEFVARYAKGAECSKLVSECIDALGDVANLHPIKKTVTTIPAASACVVLANLTRSVEFALFLVQHKKVHLSVGLMLHQREDSTTLFPAIALLDRLSIPTENKSAIFNAGIVYEVPRFLTGFDAQPTIQREAVSVLRKIMVGHPEHLSGLGVSIPINAGGRPQDQSPPRTEEQSGLLAALNLFRRTSNVEAKIEVGRLVVEVCRTLLHLTVGHPEDVESAVHQIFGNAGKIARPITFLACNGPSQAVRGEGWFGLAVLSIWEHGRPSVINCLADKDVQQKMDEALEAGERALCENISLMLTKLHLFPRNLVSASTRDTLERAASNVGLPPIWPVMAAAA